MDVVSDVVWEEGGANILLYVTGNLPSEIELLSVMIVKFIDSA